MRGSDIPLRYVPFTIGKECQGALSGLLGPGAGVNRVVGRNKKTADTKSISALDEI